MFDLIKVDLKRIVKDKLFLVVLILGGVFALISPLLYKFLSSVMGSEEMMGLAVNAKAIFFESFKLSSNFGLIFPVFTVIILCKDFSYGTVRNKLLAGKSRADIFLASFFATAIVTCLTVLAHALLSLAFALCFFEYQAGGGFAWSDFGYLLLSVVFEMLLYLFVSAALASICAATGNIGLSIVGYVSVNFLCSIVGSITSTVLMLTAEADRNPIVVFLDKINLFTSTVIGGGTSYGFADTMYVIIPVIVGTAAFLGLGLLAFKKKNLK